MDAQEMWSRLKEQSLLSLAQQMGVSPKRIVRALEEAGLLGNEPSDPTPREVRSGRKDARRRWTPVMTESRRIGRRSSNQRF